MKPRAHADMSARRAGPTLQKKRKESNKKLASAAPLTAGAGATREFGDFVVTIERQGKMWRIEIFNGDQTWAKMAANPAGRAVLSFLKDVGLPRSDIVEFRRWVESLANAAAVPTENVKKAEEAQAPAGAVATEKAAARGDEASSSAEAHGDITTEEPPRKSEEPSAGEAPPVPAAPQQTESPPQTPEAAEGAAQKEAGPLAEEVRHSRDAEAEKPPEAAGPPPPEAGESAKAEERPPEAEAVLKAEEPPKEKAEGIAEVAEPPEAPPASAEARPAAAEQTVECTAMSYGRCSAFGITELLVERAKREPAGVRLALLQIWRTVLAGLGADPRQYEPMWIGAGLDPQAAITPEDRARAEAAAEEALKECRLCSVNLGTFLRLLKRVTLAERPDGETILVIEVAYGGAEATVATKTSQWIKERKDGTKYVIPLVLRERLRQLGLTLDVDPFELYVELSRRAERYQQVADAYLRPILLHAVEALRASPHLSKCSRDRRVIYIATDLFRTALWYFNSHVELGKKRLYEAFRRHGLLAHPDSVAVTLSDEFGEKVRKRALAFFIERLSEFIETDVQSLCKAAAMAEEEEADLQAPPPKAGP